jgi:drug/metabolite transporter (DMT)-like permease
MNTPPRLAWIAWIAVCVIWGTTYLGIRVALESVPPALMAGFRWTIAGTILAAVVLLRGGSIPPVRTWPGLALLGVLMIGFGNGFVVWAEQFVPSGLTAVVIATSPFWMVSSEAVFGGDRLSRGALAGLVVGFSGIVLLVWPDLRAGGAHATQFAGGLVALQLASAGWAAGSSYAKRHKQDDVVAATAMQMLFGGVLMLAIGTLAGEWRALAFTPRTAGALTYLTLAGSLGAFLAYIYALRHLPVTTVSLYAYINPIIAVVLGALLLGEPFGSRVIVAAGLVLAGLALVRYASLLPPARPDPSPASTAGESVGRPLLASWSSRIRRRAATAR